MPALSDKAKGKQRAIDPLDDNSNPIGILSSSSRRNVTIRFTDGHPDIIITVEAKDCVRDVKRKIRQRISGLSKRRLRLIYSGKLLVDSFILLDWISSLEKRQQRSTATQERADVRDSEDGEEGFEERTRTTWLHCSIGAEMEEEKEETDERAAQAQIKPLRGFDRLAAAGFSEEDIASFRRTFHSQTSGDYLDEEPLGEDQDFDEHARALEEQWIESLDDAGASPIGQPSASATFVKGLLMGFFFPLLPFFFVRTPRPAVFWENGSIQERDSNTVFPKRMQMAMVLGFAINLTFGMWRYLLGG